MGISTRTIAKTIRKVIKEYIDLRIRLVQNERTKRKIRDINDCINSSSPNIIQLCSILMRNNTGGRTHKWIMKWKAKNRKRRPRKHKSRVIDKSNEEKLQQSGVYASNIIEGWELKLN